VIGKRIMIASFGSEHYAITIFCSHPLFGAFIRLPI